MDQDVFRETYHEVNTVQCAFEKSVLTNQCTCARAERFCIAEREGVRCTAQASQQRCLHLQELLREQARFALRETGEAPRLAHGKAMRIQVGGLRGIRALLDPETPAHAAIEGVDALLDAAERRYGSLAQLPFSDIMPQIAAYRGRSRRRRDR